MTYKVLNFTLFLLIVLGFILSISLPAIAATVSPSELRALQRGPFYDPNSGNGCAVSGSTLPDTGPGGLGSGSKIYILGDSITVGASSEYANSFEAKDMDVTIDASTSRSINGAGQDGNKLSGLGAVEDDQAAIAEASLIIVALGTNGGNSAQSIGALHEAIRKYNTAAPMFWVDTTVIAKSSYVPKIREANQAIYNNQFIGYTPISWFKLVTPGGDPQNPSGSETDALELVNVADGYNVHPTAAGSKALAQLVVDTVTGTATPNPTNEGASCFSGSGGNLPGNTNEEKVYNYLRIKGLSSIQIAGVMGNLHAEGHFEPKLVQYEHVNCRGEISQAGKPTSLCDFIVIDNNTGYGIAQWTSGGRQQALHDFAVKQKTIDGDLTTQLDFLWQEFNTTFSNSVLTPLKATNDLTVATDIVLKKFECPSPCVNIIKDPTSTAYQAAYQRTLDERKALAQAILTKYGSGG